jgi:hypothetical protein
VEKGLLQAAAHVWRSACDLMIDAIVKKVQGLLSDRSCQLKEELKDIQKP